MNTKLFASVVVLVGSTSSAAGAQRARAAISDDPLPKFSGSSACSKQCQEQGRRCGQGSRPNDPGVQARIQQCHREAQQCASRCAAAAAAAAATPAAPTPAAPPPATTPPPPFSPPTITTPEGRTFTPTTPIETPEDTSDAQLAALTRAFRANDAARMKNADDATRLMMEKIFEILCKTPNVPAGLCVSGRTGQLALPPMLPLPSDRRVSNRFTKKLPEPEPPEPPSPPPKRAEPTGKGCYVIDDFLVRGPGCDGCFPAAVVAAAFDKEGNVLLRNFSSDHTAWVGFPAPLNVDLPPRIGYDGSDPVRVPLAIYRAKNDTRDPQTAIRIKYWTESEKKCGRAVAPGFTTLEEWGNPYGPGSTE